MRACTRWDTGSPERPVGPAGAQPPPLTVPVPPDEGWLEPLPPETLPDGGEL
jgi:hypothetical protein